MRIASALMQPTVANTISGMLSEVLPALAEEYWRSWLLVAYRSAVSHGTGFLTPSDLVSQAVITEGSAFFGNHPTDDGVVCVVYVTAQRWELDRPHFRVLPGVTPFLESS
jgi:hypothetical protein